MSVITFTTDWGSRDFHGASLKGMMLSLLPEVRLVDISQEVARHNIQQAAYIFKNSFHHFPVGSLHFIGVHSQPRQAASLLAIKKDQHIFIGLNDGFFSLVFEEEPIDVIEIRPLSDSGYLYDLPTIAHAMLHLLRGKNLYELGPRPDNFLKRSAFEPTFDDDLIHGVVIYVDDYGNIITNISRELFEKQRRGRKFEVVVRKIRHSIDTIYKNYSEVEPGNALAVFNAAGYLELAINEDNAYNMLNLRLNDNIRIEFK